MGRAGQRSPPSPTAHSFSTRGGSLAVKAEWRCCSRDTPERCVKEGWACWGDQSRKGKQKQNPKENLEASGLKKKKSFFVLTRAGQLMLFVGKLILSVVAERRSGLQILNQNQTPVSWSLGFNKVVSSKSLQFGTNSVRLERTYLMHIKVMFKILFFLVRIQWCLYYKIGNKKVSFSYARL